MPVCRAKCGPSLTACARGLPCNNDVLTALLCLAPPDGGTLTTCFGPGPLVDDSPDVDALTCLSTNCTCQVAGDGGAGDGGTTEAGPTEAGADAGDGG